MRDFLIIAGIVSTITWGSFTSLKFYERMNETMKVEFGALEEHFRDDEEKEKIIQRIEDFWLNVEKWLIILQDHASIGNIENDLYECIHHSREGDFSHFKLYKDKVLAGFDDIIKREKLLLVDVL